MNIANKLIVLPFHTLFFVFMGKSSEWSMMLSKYHLFFLFARIVCLWKKNLFVQLCNQQIAAKTSNCHQ